MFDNYLEDLDPKTVQSIGLIDGLRRGLVVRQAGLNIIGLVLPTDWDSLDYEQSFADHMAAHGVQSNQFILRSDKIDTLGFIV